MKHHLIPATLLPDQVEAWLKNNCKEQFEDELKHIFDEDELNEFARESSRLGGEIIDLTVKLSGVTESIKKGNPVKFFETIPQTIGINALTNQRLDYDTKVKLGYELIKRHIYGLVDFDNEIMIYVDPSGQEAEDRRRELSTKEKREYIGLLMKSGTNN